MSIEQRPLTTFRFEVMLDLDEETPGLSSPLCDAAFAECDGLDMTMQPKTLQVGGVNDRQVQLLGPVTYGQVTLKRGMTDNLQLWDWFARGTRPGSVLTAHGEITLWRPDGTPAIQFTLTGCLPTKLRAPSFNAREGLVAVEELSLVYAQLVVAAPGSGAGISIGASLDVGVSASASASAGFSAGVSGDFQASASAGASFSGGIG
jgi:phage tail-like protein